MSQYPGVTVVTVVPDVTDVTVVTVDPDVTVLFASNETTVTVRRVTPAPPPIIIWFNDSYLLSDILLLQLSDILLQL